MAMHLKVDNEKGSVMNVALLVLLVLSLIGFSLSKISAIDTKIAGNEKLERVAFYAAEAGLERAMQLLEEGTLSDADWFGTKIAFGDASYRVDVFDFNDSASTSSGSSSTAPPPSSSGSTSTAPPSSSTGSPGSSSAGTGSSSSWSWAGGLEDDFDDLEFYDGMGGMGGSCSGSSSSPAPSSSGSSAPSSSGSSAPSSSGSTGTSSPSFSSTASFGSTSGMFDDDAFEFFENEITNDDDLVLIRSTGYMNDVQRSIEVVFSRVSFAHTIRVDGALATYADPVEVDGDNTAGGASSSIRNIDGEDVTVPLAEDCFSCNGSVVSGTHDTVPGLYTQLSAPILTDINDVGNIKGNASIQTTGSLNTTSGWEVVVEDLIQDGVVDNRLNEDGSTSTSEVQTLGTRAEPKITYIAGGDFTFNNDVTGNGILIADNGLIFNDNLQFEGLIIIRNLDGDDAGYELDIGTVNARIFGAVVVAGTSTNDLRLRKDGYIRYSTEALKNIEGLLSGVVPKVVTWREY